MPRTLMLGKRKCVSYVLYACDAVLKATCRMMVNTVRCFSRKRRRSPFSGRSSVVNTMDDYVLPLSRMKREISQGSWASRRTQRLFCISRGGRQSQLYTKVCSCSHSMVETLTFRPGPTKFDSLTKFFDSLLDGTADILSSAPEVDAKPKDEL